MGGREFGHVKSLPSPSRAESGTLAPGQRQRRRLPETAPFPAPRPPPGRPAARRAGPAGSVSAAHKGSAGGAGAAPGPAPSPSRRRWLGQGGARFSKNLLYRVGGALGCRRSGAPVWKNKEQEGVPE